MDMHTEKTTMVSILMEGTDILIKNMGIIIYKFLIIRYRGNCPDKICLKNSHEL
jgi:hypothetical protein